MEKIESIMINKLTELTYENFCESELDIGGNFYE